MNKADVTHRNLNNGKKTTIYYPLSESEFKNQFAEIFDGEHYKLGRRKKEAIYVDLGANIGLTTLYFAPYAKKIYAIEPSTVCCEAFKLNTKHLKDIFLYKMAIFPRKTKEYLYQVAEESAPQTLFSSGSNNTFGREMVDCVPIDQFFKEVGIEHIDVMKIDVESSEFVIFPDKSFGNVASKIDFIIGEAHYNRLIGCIPDFIPIMLKEWGFKTKFLPLDNLTYSFHYTDENEKVKVYTKQCNTMFIAQK